MFVNDLQQQMILIERKIHDNQLTEALSELKDCEAFASQDSRILFDLGTVYLLLEKYDLARVYFQKTLATGYNSYKLYYNAGIVEERQNNFPKAEEFYLTATKIALGDDETIVQEALFAYYLRIGAIEKARAFAISICNSHPERYSGYHMLNVLDFQDKNYAEVVKRLDFVSTACRDDSVYLIDAIVAKEEEGAKAVFEWLEANKEFEQKFPEIVLREKVKCLISSKEKNSIPLWFARCWEKYQTDDFGIVAVMLLLIEEKYIEAGNLANEILISKDGEIDVAFAVILALGVIALYYAYEKKPPREQKVFCLYCMERVKMWLDEFGADTVWVDDTVALFQNLKPSDTVM